jgi:hypothetical protein
LLLPRNACADQWTDRAGAAAGNDAMDVRDGRSGTGHGDAWGDVLHGLRRLFACYGYCTKGRQDELLACTDLRRDFESDPIKFYQLLISFLVSHAQPLRKTRNLLII